MVERVGAFYMGQDQQTQRSNEDYSGSQQMDARFSEQPDTSGYTHYDEHSRDPEERESF